MRIERTKRALAAFLAVMLMAGVLSGCGKKQEQGGQSGDLSDFVYVPSYATIDEAVQEMSNLCCVGDTIFFTANIPVHSDGTPVTQEELDARDKYYEDLYSDSGAMTAATADVAVAENAPADPVTGEATADVIPTEEPDFDITYTMGLYSIKTDGSGYTQLTDYVAPQKPDGDNSYVNLNKICADSEGNLWVAESVSQTIFDLPEGFDPATDDQWEYYVKDENTNFIRKLSPTGAELGVIDLTPYVEVPEGEDAQYYQFYVSDMNTDAQGNVYISDGSSTVFVANNNCEYQFKVSVDGWLSALVPLKDGSIAVSSNDRNSGEMKLKAIDLAAKAWGVEKKMPNDAWNISSGGTAYDFCYTDSSSLYGYDMATETETKVLTWLNCDVNSDSVQYSTILDDGNVFVISRDWNRDNGNNNYEIITLVKTPRSEVKEKTVLTMATLWTDYTLRGQILKFNKSNPDYRIEIKDYSEYSTDEDWNAGLTKLNTEIISGTVPDIIDISQLPYQQYAAKGLLEDLTPYLDSDPDYSKEDLVQSIIKAAEIDGKLYQIMSGFQIMSVVGSPSVVGTEMGWTMAEMQDIINQHPEADLPFGMYMTRENVLQYFCMLNMDDYMDWSTGQCSFNSDEFKNLLTFAKSFPSNEEFSKAMEGSDGSNWVDPATLIQEGRQLFNFFSASDFDSFQYDKASFGGSITFKGLPCSDRSGNVASFNGGLSMTTSCKNKEGAWQFMRTLLSEDTQKNQWYFPISQKVYDDKLAESMKQEYTTDENGNKIPVSHGGMSYGNGETIDFYAITREEADQFNAMIDSVTKVYSNDTSLIDLITEDAAAFFAGEKDVNQTADIIQSRMNIYINEQR